MIRAGEFANDAEQQRFRAEAETAAHLDHPHIVPVYEVGQARKYFAMKLIDGDSLAGRIAGRKASRPESEKMAPARSPPTTCSPAKAFQPALPDRTSTRRR